MSAPPTLSDLSYLTADLPGIGGVIKSQPEDFIVEEIPATDPLGQGEHLWLYVEKRQQTTLDVARRLAKMFHVRRHAIGYAGLKDKHAVTRQLFSVHLPSSSSHDARFLERFAYTPYKLLWSKRHTRKLRRGHHAGNRFVLRIRQIDPSAVQLAQPILARLARQGVPNFVGPQRFGFRQHNHLLGRLLIQERWQEMLDLLLGQPLPTDSPQNQQARQAYDQHDYAQALALWPRALHHDRQALDVLRQGKSPRQAVLAIDGPQRHFLISATQSAIFNLVLDRRLRAGLFARLLPGDLAWKHDSEAVFAVDQTTADLENSPVGRVPNLQVSPSGPMWGADMLKPAGQPLEWETQALADLGLCENDLAAMRPEICEPFNDDDPPPPALDSPPLRTTRQGVSGSRRPLRVILSHPTLAAGSDSAGPFLELSFVLPHGSFATTVLREIIKSPALPDSE
ncbi:MAG: tRNA pseudouridine(13) synthase TruD [Phycisphaeraceae bacterium]|nr:tRNA pseudouridine(13) synthase TruD [Phycisphaeraceae bacterium]